MRLLKYIRYRLASGHRRGFGLHSPYLFHLMTNVIEEDLPYYKYLLVEKIRAKLLRSDERIGIVENGEKHLVPIGKAVKSLSIDAKYGQLLFRLVNFYKPNAVVEYGADTGVSTLYLAFPASRTDVFALCRQPELGDLARSIVDRYGVGNVRWQKDTDICHTLEGIVDSLPEKTFLYFHKTDVEELRPLLRRLVALPQKRLFVVLPNLYDTAGMWQLWREMCGNDRVRLSLNLYEVGLLIVDPELQKEDYTLDF